VASSTLAARWTSSPCSRTSPKKYRSASCSASEHHAKRIIVEFETVPDNTPRGKSKENAEKKWVEVSSIVLDSGKEPEKDGYLDAKTVFEMASDVLPDLDLMDWAMVDDVRVS